MRWEQAEGIRSAVSNLLLQTDRLFLREFRLDEATRLFDLDQDPEVMRFISKGEPTSMARIGKEILPRFLAYYEHSPPRGFWAAHERDHDEFIGWFHLRPDKITPEEMELGYRLKRSAWGRGLATEGSRALIERAFGDWNYPKISARTLTINLASRRVMEKAGLVFEHDFTWGADALPGWTEAERRAVKYSLRREDYRL